MKDKQTISGITTVVFYYLILIYPFLTGYYKGYIGWNNKDNDKYILYSTALENGERMGLYCLILGYTVAVSFFFYDHGYFVRDKILVIPVMCYMMSVFLFFVNKVPMTKDYIVYHNIVAGLLVVFCLVATVIWNLYIREEEYDNEKELQIVMVVYYVGVFLLLFVGFVNWYNGHMMKIPMMSLHVSRNLLGILEVVVFILFGIITAFMIGNDI